MSIDQVPSLSERLAALKSDSTESFPIHAIIALYNKAKGNESCYRDYMENAKMLIDWLSPICIISDSPNIYCCPAIIDGYAVNKLAEHIVNALDLVALDEVLAARRRIRSIILYHTAKSMLSET